MAYKDLSPYLVQAAVATEDVRFYQHSGSAFHDIDTPAGGGEEAQVSGQPDHEDRAEPLRARTHHLHENRLD